MGLSFSCPGGDADLDERLEALFMRSLSFSGDYVKSTFRSVSYNGRDSEPVLLKAFGSGKLIIEGALSFNRREMDPFHLETAISLEDPSPEKQNPNKTRKRTRFGPVNEMAIEVPMSEPSSPKHEAAVKLQKVYKSFRTRRQLADCAVLVEQRWWKLLDFALLRRSSVSFFDIEKPESAVSKWSRAKSRAAKVGKGLSKNEKARKLALQHWLEAIDPRHRYGHNLHFYYDSWLRCESRQPFFYWLDVGEGKEVSLEQHCPRSKLQQQCIKYLGPKEREEYEVVVEEGKFLYKKTRQLLDTTEGSTDTKWIFVLSASKNLYVGQKRKGTFQHSSFLAGGATSAAGRLEVENGILKAVWPHSGHYRPTEENFQEFVSFLKEHNVDLTDVKESPSEEEEESWTRLRASRSELDLSKTRTWETDKPDVSEPVPGKVAMLRRSISFDATTVKSPSCSSAGHKLEGEQKEAGAKIILGDQESEEDEDEEEEEEGVEEDVEADGKANSHEESSEVVEDPSSMTKRHYMFRKPNLFVEEQEEDEEAFVPSELILRRINSKKGMKSYQLGQQLSFKWTTGAGPRIGCVRDYPSELQLLALEQVNLSPRSAGASRWASSPRNLPSPRPKAAEASPLKDAQPNRPDADR